MRRPSCHLSSVGILTEGSDRIEACCLKPRGGLLGTALGIKTTLLNDSNRWPDDVFHLSEREVIGLRHVTLFAARHHVAARVVPL